MSLAHSTWRVIANHAGDHSEPLRVRAGDLLGFERRPTEWKGWIWCTTPDGLQGWVPENRVSVEGEMCTMLRDYTSLELAVHKGEALVVGETESGWAWAENSAGDTGWVPLRCLERLSQEPKPDR